MSNNSSGEAKISPGSDPSIASYSTRKSSSNPQPGSLITVAELAKPDLS
jgi:hypothetical protein